jgi:hypothetical protein
MIKTGDLDKAADNLQLLVDTGLISNPSRLIDFLNRRTPGNGPVLPTFWRALDAPTRTSVIQIARADLDHVVRLLAAQGFSSGPIITHLDVIRSQLEERKLPGVAFWVGSCLYYGVDDQGRVLLDQLFRLPDTPNCQSVQETIAIAVADLLDARAVNRD